MHTVYTWKCNGHLIVCCLFGLRTGLICNSHIYYLHTYVHIWKTNTQNPIFMEHFYDQEHSKLIRNLKFANYCALQSWLSNVLMSSFLNKNDSRKQIYLIMPPIQRVNYRQLVLMNYYLCIYAPQIV